MNYLSTNPISLHGSRVGSTSGISIKQQRRIESQFDRKNEQSEMKMIRFRSKRIIKAAFLAAWLLFFSRTFSLADQPHMLLIIADDVSCDDLGCYGHPFARTPNIDALARNGRRFDQAYLTASSCSPSRSSIITGRYPHNNGKASELHQPIAAHLPWFPQLLRDAGYYTAIVGKHHMSVDEPGTTSSTNEKAFDLVDAGKAPGNNGGHSRWRSCLQERPKDKPFFGWFAALDAHRDWDADKEWDDSKYGPKHLKQNVVVPPFLVDNDATRSDLASYYNEVTRFDYFVGQVVDELKAQQMLDDTLIFILADNARAFPRAKTRLHDSGMKTYLIAHWPKGIASPGKPSSKLVSAIDLAPTYLEAAGVTRPATFQGVSLLLLFKSPDATVRQYAFSEHNWHDYEAHGRAVRSEEYLYIRNRRPEFAWQGPADSVRSPSHQSLLAAQASGTLTASQSDVLLVPRPKEELYRIANDPNQTKNLIDSAEHVSMKQSLSGVLDRWIDETGDDVPDALSVDSFDRQTGQSLKKRDKAFRGTPVGDRRGAAFVNSSGPR
jgi:N-sulfoglucosamine sulfohydrolase